MDYFKSALIGLSIFGAGLVLFRAISLLLQRMQAHIANHPAGSDYAEVSWSISLDPYFSLFLLAIVAILAAIWTYRRLESRSRGSQ